MEENPKNTSKKTVRSILLTVLLVLTAMAATSLWTSYQVILAGAHARYMGIKNVSSEKIAKIIRGAEMNANNIFEEVNKNLDSPEDVIAALKSKATLNLDVRGYFAAFVPDYFPEKGTWFEPYIYQPEYGGFDYRQVGSARHNYTKSPWYVRAKDTRGSFWSEPYYYYDGTTMSGHYSTYVKPLYNAKGDLACVCGADMKFEWLVKELKWADESSRNNKVMNKYLVFSDLSYYTVILDSDGTCLAHPEEKEMAITDEAVLKDLRNRKSGVADLDIDGQTCRVFYGPIEFINWSVAVIVPKYDIQKPILPIVALLLSMVVIGILIVWLVCRRK
jgi:hypothetical protein